MLGSIFSGRGPDLAELEAKVIPDPDQGAAVGRRVAAIHVLIANLVLAGNHGLAADPGLAVNPTPAECIALAAENRAEGFAGGKDPDLIPRSIPGKQVKGQGHQGRVVNQGHVNVYVDQDMNAALAVHRNELRHFKVGQSHQKIGQSHGQIQTALQVI